MRIRRAFPIALVVVVVAAAVTLAVQLRKHAPPETARLLPGGDAFFYLDLRWARRANSGKTLAPVSHDPEYERFIRETGFEFERDLDEAAFAIHYPASWPGGGTGGSSKEDFRANASPPILGRSPNRSKIITRTRSSPFFSKAGHCGSRC